MEDQQQPNDTQLKSIERVKEVRVGDFESIMQINNDANWLYEKRNITKTEFIELADDLAENVNEYVDIPEQIGDANPNIVQLENEISKIAAIVAESQDILNSNENVTKKEISAEMMPNTQEESSEKNFLLNLTMQRLAIARTLMEELISKKAQQIMLEDMSCDENKVDKTNMTDVKKPLKLEKEIPTKAAKQHTPSVDVQYFHKNPYRTPFIQYYEPNGKLNNYFTKYSEDSGTMFLQAKSRSTTSSDIQSSSETELSISRSDLYTKRKTGKIISDSDSDNLAQDATLAHTKIYKNKLVEYYRKPRHELDDERQNAQRVILYVNAARKIVSFETKTLDSSGDDEVIVIQNLREEINENHKNLLPSHSEISFESLRKTKPCRKLSTHSFIGDESPPTPVRQNVQYKIPYWTKNIKLNSLNFMATNNRSHWIEDDQFEKLLDKRKVRKPLKKKPKNDDLPSELFAAGMRYSDLESYSSHYIKREHLNNKEQIFKAQGDCPLTFCNGGFEHNTMLSHYLAHHRDECEFEKAYMNDKLIILFKLCHLKAGETRCLGCILYAGQKDRLPPAVRQICDTNRDLPKKLQSWSDYLPICLLVNKIQIKYCRNKNKEKYRNYEKECQTHAFIFWLASVKTFKPIYATVAVCDIARAQVVSKTLKARSLDKSQIPTDIINAGNDFLEVKESELETMAKNGGKKGRITVEISIKEMDR